MHAAVQSFSLILVPLLAKVSALFSRPPARQNTPWRTHRAPGVWLRARGFLAICLFCE
jgi:hypothetical protein